MATESVAASTRPAIIVAVNATRRCSETLEMAAALATATGANLEVVYVEDENLLRLADLPVTREIDRVSGAAREMDSGRIRRALQCEARRLRNELARIGRATAVRSTGVAARGASTARRSRAGWTPGSPHRLRAITRSRSRSRTSTAPRVGACACTPMMGKPGNFSGAGCSTSARARAGVSRWACINSGSGPRCGVYATR